MSYPVEDWDYNRLLEKMLSLPACYLFQKLYILLDHGFLNEN